MYRRPKFLEILLEIRREMALEADYDVDLFAELARSGVRRVNSNGNPAKYHLTEPADIVADDSELLKTRSRVKKNKPTA